MSFSIIVALAENKGIGKNNDLLWYISEDLKRFKRLTTGHTIIMGKNTFNSLPKGALPNRRNMIITSKPQSIKNCKTENCIVVDSIEAAIKACNPDEENFIIGGGSIYKQMLPYANRLYLTQVHENADADIFFPDFSIDEWQETEREDHLEHNPPFSYVTLERKK